MKPQNILEIGTAVGYSSSFFASLSDDIQITTIESNEETYNKAIDNINKLGYKDRINVCLGDAREVLEEFGRYPYHNEDLGRESTPAELKALEERKDGFYSREDSKD